MQEQHSTSSMQGLRAIEPNRTKQNRLCAVRTPPPCAAHRCHLPSSYCAVSCDLYTTPTGCNVLLPPCSLLGVNTKPCLPTGSDQKVGLTPGSALDPPALKQASIITTDQQHCLRCGKYKNCWPLANMGGCCRQYRQNAPTGQGDRPNPNRSHKEHSKSRTRGFNSKYQTCSGQGSLQC